MSDAEALHTCANHPNVTTTLRCNRCGKYICTRCAVLTPVGYRCRECVRGQQSVFYTAGARDYLVAALVALPLSLLAGFLANLVLGTGLGWLLIFGGPIAGGVIADLVHRAVGRRRGRYLWLVVCGSVIAGGLPFVGVRLVLSLVVLLAGGGTGAGGGLLSGFGIILYVVFAVVYFVLAAASAYSRLRFGR